MKTSGSLPIKFNLKKTLINSLLMLSAALAVYGIFAEMVLMGMALIFFCALLDYVGRKVG